jgi:Holliday junction DNA helicase RuvB
LLRRGGISAIVEGDGTVTHAIADSALVPRLGVDHLGLDSAVDDTWVDPRKLSGRAVGIETMSATAITMLEEVDEPYLLQQGLINAHPALYMLAQKAWNAFGHGRPEPPSDLFGG